MFAQLLVTVQPESDDDGGLESRRAIEKQRRMRDSEWDSADGERGEKVADRPDSPPSRSPFSKG